MDHLAARLTVRIPTMHLDGSGLLVSHLGLINGQIICDDKLVLLRLLTLSLRLLPAELCEQPVPVRGWLSRRCNGIGASSQ
jgi:hypothetical protein